MSRIKEIWCMHHSHLDVGYTHPQPMLVELQGDYIEQAMELCEKTRNWPGESQFRWTCEASYPIVKWMEHAEPEKLAHFRRLVKEGRISIAALPMHTTPCNTDVQMITMMRNLNELREAFSSDMKTAVNHDINGQPWPLSQILLDSGVDFYMTGINIHFGGIPFRRPMAFRWKSPDGRELLSYVGEHYSLFSQFFHTCEGDTEKMHQGIVHYADRLEAQDHDWDFAFLTATNPPLFDNNCPDAGLADLIRRYNAKGYEYKVRFATPEMLRDKLLSMGRDSFPVYSGDWTDYWNFGCASAARETRVNRKALKALESAGVLECMTGDAGSRYRAVRREAEENALVYHEHTWGASQAISDPEDYESQSQYVHKMDMAYKAADLAGYLVANRMEALACNPYQADEMEGIVAVNPTGVSQEVELNIPLAWMEKERQLSAVRAKRCIPYLDLSQPKPYFAHEETKNFGILKLPPYSSRVIPFEELAACRVESVQREKISHKKGVLETPYYRVSVNESTGRISQIYDKCRKKELLDEEKGWAFFEIIRETVDGRFHEKERRTLFPRDVDQCNKNVSLWNHGWKAKRTGAERILEWDLKIEGRTAVLTWKPELAGTGYVEQQAVFYSDSPAIDLKIKLNKLAVHEPEGLYLAFPLKLAGGWECSYLTAGQFVKLDEEQLGQMCRDWVTVDGGVAVYDERICYGLACPDAPMVQVGGFHFGRELKRIKRDENPLLLAWPLNNYWDTNFVSGQSGMMEFSYRFFLTEEFQPNQVYGEFVKGEHRGLIGAAVKASKGECRAVEFQQEGIITAVYPAREGGMLLVLRNRSAERRKFSFQIPGWEKLQAWEVDIQEKKKNELSCCGEAAEVILAPQALMLVLARASEEIK